METVRDLVESLVDRRLMARRRARRDSIVIRRSGAARQPTDGAPRRGARRRVAEAELAKLPAPAKRRSPGYYREHAAEFTAPGAFVVTRVVTATEKAAERVRGELARGASEDEARAAAAITSSAPISCGCSRCRGSPR